jgi:polyisoprenyl-phosphate glycosyltransferase
MTCVSVVLPVYNEAKALPLLAARIAEVLGRSPLEYEIIFVNDGSRDETPQVLDQLALASEEIRVVHLSRNFGQQAAVHAGLAHARGDAVVLMDADMQDAPEALPQFLAAWREGCEVVYAVRADRKENLAKRFLFAAFHRLLAAVAAPPMPADAGLFGLIDRRVARQILALTERDRYFPGLRSWVGFRQKGIVVERNARYDDHPRVSLRGLFSLAKTALFSFSSLPLRLFQWMGILAALVFLGLSGFSIFCKLFTDLAIPGWTSHVLIGSFFGALNALGISILGEYVIRIYDQVRGRPTYIVDRTMNVPSPAAAGDRSRDAADDVPYVELMAEAKELLKEANIPAPTAFEPSSFLS